MCVNAARASHEPSGSVYSRPVDVCTCGDDGMSVPGAALRPPLENGTAVFDSTYDPAKFSDSPGIGVSQEPAPSQPRLLTLPTLSMNSVCNVGVVCLSCASVQLM